MCLSLLVASNNTCLRRRAACVWCQLLILCGLVRWQISGIMRKVECLCVLNLAVCVCVCVRRSALRSPGHGSLFYNVCTTKKHPSSTLNYEGLIVQACRSCCGIPGSCSLIRTEHMILLIDFIF